MLRPNWTAYLIALALAALAAGLGYGWHQQSVKTALARQAAQEAVQALADVQATLVFREKSRAATARKTALLAASVDRVLVSTPSISTWAAEPVPNEVQDALRAALPAASPSSVHPSP